MQVSAVASVHHGLAFQGIGIPRSGENDCFLPDSVLVLSRRDRGAIRPPRSVWSDSRMFQPRGGTARKFHGICCETESKVEIASKDRRKGPGRP